MPKQRALKRIDQPYSPNNFAPVVITSPAASGEFPTDPAITDFTNAVHTHQNTAGGGKLDHGLALNGLSDDDHAQYALLLGRAGGQTLNGGTASGDDLTIKSTTHATKGDISLDTFLTIASAGLVTINPGDVVMSVGNVLFNNSATATQQVYFNFGSGNSAALRRDSGYLEIRVAPTGFRFVSNDGINELAIMDTSGNLLQKSGQHIDTTELRARSSAGLRLSDNAGALGVFVEDGGQVGIGTTAPAYPLEVLGDFVISKSGGIPVMTFSSADAVTTTADILFAGSGIIVADQNIYIGLDQDNDSTFAEFTIGHNAPSTAMQTLFKVTESGNVGIGILNPQGLGLHVGPGADAPNSTNTWIYASNNGTTNIVVRNSTADLELKFGCGSTVGTVGTVTNHPLQFLMNAGEVGRFDTNGQFGIGTQTPGGMLSVKAGTSADWANAGGIIDVDTTVVGNISTGEDDLSTFSVPANTLAVNGQSIWFEASGTYANNANVKTIRARFGTAGTSLIMALAPTVSTAGNWIIRGRVIRTGAATQKGYAQGVAGTVNGVGVSVSMNQTLSGAVSLRITGDATTDNDIVIQTLVVGYDDANS